jgi:hypothetical protein
MSSSIYEDAKAKYFHYFKDELSQFSIANLSRSLQVKFEDTNKLKAFQWDSILYWVIPDEVLFICGAIDFANNDVLEKIKKATLVIIHEPFPFSPDGGGEDFSVILPNDGLYLDERLRTRSISLGKYRIGYHIRRGDYSEWEGGRYYFSDEYWVNLISSHERVNESKVWLFSNHLNVKLIEDLKKIPFIDFEISGGDFYQDFTRLMCMNEINGPPSTFTSLAVTIGRMLDSDIDIKLNILGR